MSDVALIRRGYPAAKASRFVGKVAIYVVPIAALVYLPVVLTNRQIFGVPIANAALLGLGLPQLNLALIAVVGAVGLNLLMGQTGLVSLGNAAFFAVGACAASVVGVQMHRGLVLAVVAAGVAGAAVGTLVGLPSVRLRGLYLLLSTMGLQFIAAWLFLKYQLRYFGPGGVGFPTPSVFGVTLGTDRAWYFLLLVVAVASVVFTNNVIRHRKGRALIAIRDHELAAGCVGIPVARSKLTVFALSSAIVSMAGALYVWYLGIASQEIFSLTLAISFISMIVIGGLGSTSGAVIGALVWQLLPRAINTLSQSVSPTTPIIGQSLNKYQADVSDMILGFFLIVVIIFRPDGLWGLARSSWKYVRCWPVE